MQEALGHVLPHTADSSCCCTAQVALGYEKLYEAQNPFDWMELISLQVLRPVSVQLSASRFPDVVWYLAAVAALY
jgi:hypothetical protein